MLLLNTLCRGRTQSDLEDMEKENASLKSENASLKSELEALQQELDAIKSWAGRFVQDAENILAYIANNEYATAPQISQALGMSESATDMHLEDLTTSNHIDVYYETDQDPEYSLAQSGRRYLHAKGLL